MSQMTVHIRSAHVGSFSVGWTAQHSLVIDRGPDDGGQGMGFNGGQLMLLALGACFANDVYREADKRDIEVHALAAVGREPAGDLAEHEAEAVEVTEARSA